MFENSPEAQNTVTKILPPIMVLTSLMVILIFGIIAVTCLGHIEITWSQVVKIIYANITLQKELLAEFDEVMTVVVWDIRLPRIITACAVGGGLAISGTIFQGLLSNPLADPYTLGVSAGAAFGASLALLLNVGFMGSYSVPLFAFIGAGATLMFVIYLSSSTSQVSSHNLILSGIIVSAILSAGISFIKYIADEQVSVIIFWLMGSLASKTWTDAILVTSILSIGILICIFYARDLNLMVLGHRTAAALGTNIRTITYILLITASMIAAVCVSVSGIIGFIGLLVPHMMRSIVGPDNRVLLPISMIAGALLLLIGDTITRAILPHEIPIGVLTALIGGPFFCYIFRKQQLERGRF
ncbi:MAG: iron complex transport system permease protein [Candidatus Magnetoglobus multicellularis str. Araruama]|uniref:Iron complex transport system permease protein n=1 Tax=Candidatus Magnetoglobus multicellularis str. Araruama TaxID=890399 RepID=A0A1V1PGF8_9BACT|nr:MAG: iron complex transport system permease protein [Candidatus Magnetoglobus multicellularis str. Araruama]